MSEPKVFKVRVELPSGEAVLLPKVSASTTEDLTSNVAKDLAEYAKLFTTISCC
jgi:hypothetical protein